MLTRDIPRAAAATGFVLVRMCLVGMVGTMRVHGTFEVRQLARGKIPSASTADGVPEMKRKKKKRSGGVQMKIKV